MTRSLLAPSDKTRARMYTLSSKEARRTRSWIELCNTLNLGYKISSLLPTKFKCYRSSLISSFLFLFLSVEVWLFYLEM
jgi:hypothetical protein